MYDGRVPLPVGAELCGGGARYRITGAPVGRGGSSLVYPASRQGSGRMFMIKECYPLCAEHEYLRRDWMVAPAAQEAGAEEYLACLRADMAREDALGQRLARGSGRALAAWETLRPCRLIVEGRGLEAPEGAFIVMEGPGRGWFLRDLLDECARPPEPGRPLRCGGLPGPELVVRIMEELLRPLRDIHREGCIHGDVQAGNLFLMGPDAGRGEIGVGRLLDFGSARELGPDGLTAPITDRRVFYTPGYAAPELLWGNDGGLRLSPASDVYSAGCMFMYLLRGEGYREARGEALALSSGLTPPLTRRQAERCGFHGEAASRLMGLLGRALAAEPRERYAGAGEMLDDLLELERLVLPPKYRLPEGLTGSPYFSEASREKELARLEADFDAGRQPLWVWGIWGVGKTELAKAFGRRMKRRGLDVHLVTGRGSLRETVLGMEFSGLSRPAAGPAREERDYRRRLDILKDWYEDSLLIIDGLGSGARDLDELRAEPEYAELCALKLRLLITTRGRPDTVTPELGPLDEAQALALYESAAPTGRSARGEVRALLHELGCHPLAVELCARAVEEDWGAGLVTPRTLLAEFRHGGGGDVHEQLRRLFALQELGEDCRGLLCHIALLPDCGLDAALFLSCEAAEDRRRLRRLEARGWVRRGADGLLRIHPLVRSVLTEELKPRDADCAAFLGAVSERLGSDTDERLYAQGADLYIRASELLEDAHGDFASCAGRCCYAVGRAAEAAYYAGECLRLREALEPPDTLALARARLNCSITERHFGDLAGAIADAERAAQLLHGLPPCVEQGRAEASLAATYAEMGDARRALRHGERALELLRDTAPGGSPALENAHLILARAHMLSGEAGDETEVERESVGTAQKATFRNPYIWILALASACMYVSRYAINGWGVIFLQEVKGFPLATATQVISVNAFLGIAGTVFSGWMSDKWFNGSRYSIAVTFGVLCSVSLGLFLYSGSGMFVNILAMVLFGIAIGVLICFVGGLMAVDLVPRRASGAALGIIGIASYVGAGIQDIISGALLDKHKTVVDGITTHDYSVASVFWIAASVLSFLLVGVVWRKAAKNNRLKTANCRQ